MASVPYKFTTTASTNLQAIRAGQAGSVTAITVTNVATAVYVKLYWFTPTSSSAGPTVGTTVPNFTFGVAASANVSIPFPDPLTANGQLWVAVTGAASDADSSNAAVGAVVVINVQ